MKYYDLSWYDKNIIDKRKKCWKLRRLTQFLVDRLPYHDEIIILTHVCRILNENGLSYCKGELRTCLRKWYDREYHVQEQRNQLFNGSIESWEEVKYQILHAHSNQKQQKNINKSNIFDIKPKDSIQAPKNQNIKEKRYI